MMYLVLIIRMPGGILDEGSSDPFNDYKVYPLVWLRIAIKIVECGKWAIELGFPLTSVSDGDESFDSIWQRYPIIDEGGTTGGVGPLQSASREDRWLGNVRTTLRKDI